MALHAGGQNGCGGDITFTDKDDLAQQIFNLWMSSPGHKANQMDDHNSHGFIAVMYSQPKSYAGKYYINFSAIFLLEIIKQMRWELGKQIILEWIQFLV